MLQLNNYLMLVELLDIAENNMVEGAFTSVKKALPSFRRCDSKTIFELLKPLQEEGVCTIIPKTKSQTKRNCIVINTESTIYTRYLVSKQNYTSTEHVAKDMYSYFGVKNKVFEQTSLFDECTPKINVAAELKRTRADLAAILAKIDNIIKNI